MKGQDRPRGRAPFSGLLVAVLASGIVLLALLSPNSMVRSDPALSLVAAQALIEHGSLRLDPYADDPDLAYDLATDYRVREDDGSFRYYSLGAPLCSVPAVLVANAVGLDMTEQADEFATQNALSALLCGIVFVLVFLVLRTYLPPAPSLVVAVVTSLGSPLISTCATALWNVDFAAVFMLTALLVVVHHDRGRVSGIALLWLPPLLVAGFLTRPTVGFEALGIAAYLGQRYYRSRTWLVVAGGVVAAGLAVVSFLMPGYYSLGRLVPRISPLEGLYGVLLSPSRGLLVYCPFLVVVAVACLVPARGRRLLSQPVMVLAVVWSLTHIAALSVREVWWGGFCFGPRMAAEVLLAAIVPTALAWRSAVEGGRRGASVLATAYLILGGFAVVVHSGQGLFNPNVQRWNHTPNVDQHPQLLMWWRFPQLLASREALDARQVALQLRRLEPYEFGRRIGSDDPAAVFANWYQPVGPRRWSRGTSPSIAFRLSNPPPGAACILEVHAGALGRQQVTLSVNGTAVGSATLGWKATTVRMEVGSSLLSAPDLNELLLEVPGARRPDSGDPRVLGVSFRWLRIDCPRAPGE